MNIGEEDEQYVIEPLESPVHPIPREEPAPIPATEPDEVEVTV
jgi:hypothetical protein